MENPIIITNRFDMGDGLSDLGARFLNSSLHRVRFGIDQADIQLLADCHKERIFRAHRTYETNKLLWHTLILRFADNVLVHARDAGRDCWIEILAPTEAEALALYATIREKLRRQRRAESPFFYMLRYDYCEFQTERVGLGIEDANEDFLRLCYGSNVLEWCDAFAHKTTAEAVG